MANNLKEREKVGTILDAAVAGRLRALAAEEGRSISAVVSEAIQRYEVGLRQGNESRRLAMEAFLTPAFKLPRREVERMLQLEYFEQ